MVKYIEFDKVAKADTILEFRNRLEETKITSFTGETMFTNIVSIVADNEEIIDELVAEQEEEINCREISYNEFKTLVKYSDQISRINAQVKTKIAQKYDLADEIAMSKRAADDAKRVTYEEYVSECIAFGDALKSEIGY